MSATEPPVAPGPKGTRVRWIGISYRRDGRRQDAQVMRHGRSVRLQRWVANPLDRLAFALRVPPPGDALLETVGRRTGRRRVTPVCDALDGDTFWIVAQRGRDTDYVRNIEADPRVRV